MNFNPIRGHFAESAALQKAALKATKALGAIKDEAKKEQEAQGAPSKVPGEMFLAQMSNVARPIKQKGQRQHISNNYKKDSCLKAFIKPYGNFFLKTKKKDSTFESLYDAQYASIFSKEPKFETKGNNNTVLNIQKYNEYRDKVQSELDAFQFDDNVREKIMNKYIENGRQVSETFYEKDFKMFKLTLAQTVINGLQTRDYSFYTMPLKKDFILKVLENCLNNPNQDFNVIYRNTVLEQQDQHLEEMGITKQANKDENGNIIGYLTRIPKTSLDDDAYEDRVRFLQTHSYHNWCTHTNMALKHIQGGDFVIYEPSDQSFSNVAFRYNDNITEIEDSRNDGKIRPKDIEYYNSIFKSFPEIKQDLTEFNLRKYNSAIADKSKFENIITKEIYKEGFSFKDISLDDLYGINDYFASDESKKDVIYGFNISYLKMFLALPNILEEIQSSDIKTLNDTFKKSDHKDIQVMIHDFNIAYFNTLIDSSNILEKIWPMDIKNLNYAFKENKDEDIQAVLKQFNLKYLDAMIENSSNISSGMLQGDLQNLNDTFKENKDEMIQEKLKQFNLKFLDSLYSINPNFLQNVHLGFEGIKDAEVQAKLKDFNKNYLNNILNSSDILKKITYPIQIFNLNEYLRKDKDENIQALLNKLNVKYLDAFMSSVDISECIMGNDFKFLNETFKENKDEKIQAKLKDFNIACLDALIKNSSKIEINMFIENIEILNDIFKENKDENIQDKLKQLNQI